jgi:NAD(P)-dependent dehydrogenase (short-subunit alcohol dehydrogenase family)
MSSTINNLFDVAGKSVVITGATGALGEAVALAMANAGARLTLAAGGAARLDEVAAAARACGAEVATLAARPDDEAKAEAIINAAVQAYGGVDVLVVASGTNNVSPITDFPQDRWQAVMDANVLGSWLMCRAAGRQMIAQGGGGKVVLVSSTRGKLGHAAGYTAYCPSKHAIDGLARSLACEWGQHGINVNAIAPTVFRSALTAWMFEDDPKGKEAREGMLKRIPLGRLGEPDDLVGAVLYLASRASDFCTGQILYVDGGYTAG